MLIDLSDVRVRCRPGPDGLARLTIDYPRTEEYRIRVLEAVAELIRPQMAGNESIDVVPRDAAVAARH